MVHQLNYCGGLCIPEKGLELKNGVTRGIDMISTGITLEGCFLLPMFKVSAPHHALLTQKPILVDKSNGRFKILEPGELDNVDYIHKLMENEKVAAIGPDCAIDPHPWVRPVMEYLDENLAIVLEALFKDGCKRVALWTNNGIGERVFEGDGNSGVIRDNKGIAYKSQLYKGKEQSIKLAHDRNILSSYQNIGHTHIHITPDDKIGFSKRLENLLENMHIEKTHDGKIGIYRCSLKELRNILIDKDRIIDYPSMMSLAIVGWEDDLENIPWNHYTKDGCIVFPDYTMSTWMGAVVRGYNQKAEGMDFSTPKTEFSKEQRRITKDYYQELLS